MSLSVVGGFAAACCSREEALKSRGGNVGVSMMTGFYGISISAMSRGVSEESRGVEIPESCVLFAR